MSIATPLAAEPALDPLVQAFCSLQGAEVFHAISHRHQIWEFDPFDVRSIHANARDLFESLLQRCTQAPGLKYGLVSLILGESGSGKIHLMRAFRYYVHHRQLGYCGYLQMSADTENYSRYLLANLLESLDQPYCAPEVPTTGLLHLSNALVEGCGLTSEQVERLRDEPLGEMELGELVCEWVDQICQQSRFARLDVDVLRALFYLQRRDPRLHSRILKYLRCENLAPYDQRLLGNVFTPKISEHDPQQMVEQFGRIISAVHHQQASLVLFIDQLEDLYNHADSVHQFRRAMDCVRQTIDNVPSSLIVISCLDDYYQVMFKDLAKPIQERLNHDPQPMKLIAERTLDEIMELVGQRMSYFYDQMDLVGPELDPIFPFRHELLAALQNRSIRDVLRWCLEYRGRCVAAGALVEPDLIQETIALAPETESDAKTAQPLVELEQAWNVFHTEKAPLPPETDQAKVEVLSWAIQHCTQEMEADYAFTSSNCQHGIEVEVMGGNLVLEKLWVGLCNKAPQGGHLSKQLKELEKKAVEAIPVIVRCTEFPTGHKTAIGKQLGELISKRHARRVLIEDSDWRSMTALRQFVTAQATSPHLDAWRKQEKPLSQIPSLKNLLHLEKLPKLPATVEPTPPVLPPKSGSKPIENNEKPKPVPPPLALPADLPLGNSGGVNSKVITLNLKAFTTHAAFLGATQSGKTTLALAIIEQLLLRGIPAVLIDRKGDLSRYACPQWWAETPSDPQMAAMKQAFRERVQVALYTPGNPNGNPISISVVPQQMASLPTHERQMMAKYSASSLASMMKYRPGGTYEARKAILMHAIQLLGEVGTPQQCTLESLVELIHQQDPALIYAIGHLESKNLPKLVQDLETLRHSRVDLLSSKAPALNIAQLLGQASGDTNKTRLSILSLKFLGDTSSIDFWVSKLLIEIDRWGNQHPQPGLQAVFFFDEADHYLPAQGKPSTKEPMENLLRRARSAGVGIFLGTQSPGDFDYRCRDNILTWFLGRITQDTAIKKVEATYQDHAPHISAKLPNQKTGEFHLIHPGQAQPFTSFKSLLETKQLTDQEILTLAQGSL